MILLLDNYDSFVHNLGRYLRRLGQEIRCERNDALTLDQIRGLRPRAIVISPGPCAPRQSGCCLDVVRQFGAEIPMLGVCLGHQVIAEACGGRIVRSPEAMHGRASLVRHDGQGLFAHLPDPLTVGRYHSLVVDEAELPDCLEVTARTEDGVVMGLRHRQWPLYGVQFHPESILTEGGFPLLANFLRLSGLPVVGAESLRDSEGPPTVEPAPLPATPMTF